MKSLLILVFISMAIAINPEYSQRYKRSLVQYNEKYKAEFKGLSPEERRKVSLFPKNMKKFVVTENPSYENAFFTPGATVMTRRPLAMPKLDIVDKTTPMSSLYKQPLIRPRLMKSRKFTIDDETLRPAIMEIVNSEVPKNIDNNVFEDQVMKTGYENYANKDYSQQKDSKEILEYSEHYVKDAKDPQHGKLDDKLIVDISSENLNKKSTDNEYYDKGVPTYYEEYPDDNISMPKKETKSLTNLTDVKVLDNQYTTEVRTKTDVINYQAQIESNKIQRDDNVSNFLRTQPVRKVEGEDFHLTLQDSKIGLQNGESLESELRKIMGDRILRSKRSKRSINIIEEENTGTTVTGFKFTGREPTLLSDLMYRNINS